jgi:nucleotide-binding universal stress UspA family protein
MTVHVLFGADLTERSRAAFDAAYTLARNSGGRLSVLHVADPELPSDFLRAEAEQAEAVLLSWVAPHIGQGVDVSVSVVAEDAGPAFEAACRRRAADLVVMGRPRRDGRQRFFRGSTIEQVASSIDVPVLCTSGGDAPYTRPLLAAGLDGNDERLVSPLTMITKSHKEGIHAVHGAGGLADVQMSYAGVAEADRHANLDDRHRTLLDSMRAEFAKAGLDGLAEAAVLDAPPVTAIADAAAAFNADLAVVGFRKREGLTRLIKRPTALAVLQACPIDVLIVPLPQSG